MEATLGAVAGATSGMALESGRDCVIDTTERLGRRLRVALSDGPFNY